MARIDAVIRQLEKLWIEKTELPCETDKTIETRAIMSFDDPEEQNRVIRFINNAMHPLPKTLWEKGELGRKNPSNRG